MQPSYCYRQRCTNNSRQDGEGLEVGEQVEKVRQVLDRQVVDGDQSGHVPQKEGQVCSITNSEIEPESCEIVRALNQLNLQSFLSRIYYTCAR